MKKLCFLCVFSSALEARFMSEENLCFCPARFALSEVKLLFLLYFQIFHCGTRFYQILHICQKAPKKGLFA